MEDWRKELLKEAEEDAAAKPAHRRSERKRRELTK